MEPKRKELRQRNQLLQTLIAKVPQIRFLVINLLNTDDINDNKIWIIHLLYMLMRMHFWVRDFLNNTDIDMNSSIINSTYTNRNDIITWCQAIYKILFQPTDIPRLYLHINYYMLSTVPMNDVTAKCPKLFIQQKLSDQLNIWSTFYESYWRKYHDYRKIEVPGVLLQLSELIQYEHEMSRQIMSPTKFIGLDH